MNTPRSIPSLAFLLVLAMATAADVQAANVGQLGNTASIAFDGNAGFSDDDLRAGLRQYAAFVIDSHPDAPLEAFLERIADALVTGYRKYGFEHAEATAAVNAQGDGIVVRIQEGKEMLNGAVVVNGVDERLATALRERLTKGKRDPDTGSSDAKWVHGKATNFENTQRITGVMNDALKEEGWFTAQHHFALDSKGADVTLTVTIDDLGTESVIGKVTVEGAERHSKDQVLEFLELADGASVDGGLLDDRRNRLYESGRFVESGIVMTRRRADGVVVDLKITLEEADDVPLLDEPLPRHAEAFLKGSKWLAAFQHSPHDIVMSGNAEGAVMQLALSPKDGLLLAVRYSQDATAQSDIVILLSTSHLLVKVPGVEGFWRYDLTLPLEATLSLGATGEVDNPFRFEATARTTTNSGQQVALPLQIRIDPVAIAIGVGGADMADSLKWQGDIMSVEKDGKGLTFDTATGRLLSAFVKDEEMDFTLSTEEGGFQRLRQKLVGDSGETNHFLADAPLTSTASFLMSAAPILMERLRGLDEDDEMPTAEEVDDLVTVGRALLDLGFLKPLDEVVKKVSESGSQIFSSRFKIPDTGGPVAENPTMLLMAQLLSAALKVLPSDSWADQFSREMVHLAHGNTTHTKKVLDSLYQDSAHIGPVGYLVMAKTLSFVDKRQAARFADMGLQHQSATDFAKDWQLLAQDPAMEQAFLGFVTALPTIDADSRAALDRVFGEGSTEELIAVFTKAESKDGQAFTDFLAPLMADLWKDSLQPEIAKQLRNLASPKAEPPRTIAMVNGVVVPHTALIPWGDGRTPEQATQIAIMTEVVHQHYLADLAKAQPDLLKQILTQGKPQLNMLRGAGMPPDVAMKALLYQHLVQRTIQGIPPASAAAAQAYYTLHKADIGRPFADVAEDLARHLTRMRGMKLVERWLSRLRENADVRLGGR